METTITAYADPEGEAPWAMQLVARVEKPAPPAHTHLLEAAASAAVRLLDQVATAGNPDQVAAVTRWREGRIRKVVRRARGNAWTTALTADTHALVRVGAAEVAAFLPGPTDQVPDPLRKLQVSGLALTDDGHDLGAVIPDGRVRVYLNPDVDLTTGKAAAQVAHAAQLAYQDNPGPGRDAWVAAGAPVVVVVPDAATWTRLLDEAPVRITDAGFTEIAAGTLTCVASHDL